MTPLCVQYKKARDKKLMLFYEIKHNRWLVSLNNKFKKFSRLIKDFRFNKRFQVMCQTKNCRKKPKRNNKLCDSCKLRKFKENNPYKYAYFVLKNNAKRRGKVFTISFDYFKEFAVKTSYMAGKGITKTSLHIDRIKEELGYIEGNLQTLTNTQNVKKYLEYQYNKNGVPENFKIKKSVVMDDTNAPF